jgi:two-component system OmpR family response regulator
MTIPNRRVASDRRRMPRGGRRSADGRRRRHPRVVVADSYEAVRRPFVRYFEFRNFGVSAAADGDELRRLVNVTRPHVIVTELALPRLAAARLTQWLGESVHTRHIPVIVTVDQFGDVRSQIGAADGVLYKPFSLSTMLEEVRRALRARPQLVARP